MKLSQFIGLAGVLISIIIYLIVPDKYEALGFLIGMILTLMGVFYSSTNEIERSIKQVSNELNITVSPYAPLSPLGPVARSLPYIKKTLEDAELVKNTCISTLTDEQQNRFNVQ